MDNSIHKQVIQLTGARRAHTGVLGQYLVKDGQIQLMGHAKDILAAAHYIEVMYAGFPLGDERIAATENAIATAHAAEGTPYESRVQPQQAVAHGQADVHRAGQQGLSDADPGASLVGNGDDAATGGADADATGGDGHAPVVKTRLPEPGTANPKLVTALGKLADSDDSHWTAQGLPKIEAVTKLSGLQGLTRAMIEGASPRRRVTA